MSPRHSEMAAHFRKQSTGGTAMPAGGGRISRYSAENGLPCSACCLRLAPEHYQGDGDHSKNTRVCDMCDERRCLDGGGNE